MLADVILNFKHEKTTLPVLCAYLSDKYADHFPKDEDLKVQNGWRVFPTPIPKLTFRILFDMRCRWKNGSRYNTVRCRRKIRTDADAKLDEYEPDHIDPPPIDNDGEKIAPATEREPGQGHFRCSSRPLKGGYCFIREKISRGSGGCDRKRQRADESTSRELDIERDLRQLYIPDNYKFKYYKPAFLILYSKSWFQIAITNLLMTIHAEI